MSTFCQRRGLVVEKSQIFVNVVCERPSSNFGHSDVEIWQPCFRYLLTTELTIITVFRLDYNLYVFSFYHNCIIIMFAKPFDFITGGNGNLHATPAQSGLLFRIENFFCLGSPLAVFLTLRWRDPQNQEYHEHILPRSLCKYLYNIYHPCDPVGYRVEPIFMKFYSQIEPVHLFGADEPYKVPYNDIPLQPLQVCLIFRIFKKR